MASLSQNFTEFATMLHSLRLYRVLALALTVEIVLSLPIDDSEPHKGRPWTVGQAVNTTSGTIIGHAATNALQVSEYLGIKYAQPPVGDLRFAAPKAYRSNATYTASNFVSATTYKRCWEFADVSSLRKTPLPIKPSTHPTHCNYERLFLSL